MRANLLDELRKPYVVTARSKGLSEARVILKYPVRVALNPFASTIGYTLPYIVSGSIIVSLVLGLPTVGPLLLQGPHRAGHVPGGDHRAPARRHDRDRHADLGHPARVDRPAHPARGHVMAEPEWPSIPRAPPLAGRARSPPAEQRIFVASQWQLMWWRFRKHKVAVASALVVIGFYLIVLGADFLAYADPNASEAQRSLMPPQRVYWFDGWRLQPSRVRGRRARATRRPSSASIARTRRRRSRSGSSPRASSTDFLGPDPDDAPSDRGRRRPRRRHRRSFCWARTCRGAISGRG